MAMAIVTTPIPPIWISEIITNWPNKVQWVAVSKTIKPVTHVALVAVKSASMKLVLWELVAEIGSISKKVPVSITPRKPNRIICDEDKDCLHRPFLRNI